MESFEKGGTGCKAGGSRAALGGGPPNPGAAKKLWRIDKMLVTIDSHTGRRGLTVVAGAVKHDLLNQR